MNTAEYMANVARIIRECFQPDDPSGSMTVATAAFLVKQRLGTDHSSFGFAKFKDVLGELERQGSLRTGTNSKHAYAIWLAPEPGDVKALGTPSPSAVEGLSRRGPFRRLRSPVWFAFVSDSTANRSRFLHRETGEVRIGLESAPSADWIAITPIDNQAERAEAVHFVALRHLSENEPLNQSLSVERWYAEFPKALANIDQHYASEWKRQRSARVLAHVESWCVQVGVNPALVFENDERWSIDRPDASRPEALRAVLLSAIGKMPTECLLELDIPPRLIIAAIRPDLLIS